MEAKIFSYEDTAPTAVERLERMLLRALDRGYRVMLDLDRLPVLDNPALRGLILILRRARGAGGTVGLRVTRPEHLRVLRITALDRVFEVAPCMA